MMILAALPFLELWIVAAMVVSSKNLPKNSQLMMCGQCTIFAILFQNSTTSKIDLNLVDPVATHSDSFLAVMDRFILLHMLCPLGIISVQSPRLHHKKLSSFYSISVIDVVMTT